MCDEAHHFKAQVLPLVVERIRLYVGHSGLDGKCSELHHYKPECRGQHERASSCTGLSGPEAHSIGQISEVHARAEGEVCQGGDILGDARAPPKK